MYRSRTPWHVFSYKFMNIFRTAILSIFLECLKISEKQNIPKHRRHRRNLLELSCKKSILSYFVKFTGKHLHESFLKKILTQPAFTCSKLTTATVEHGVEYVQS